MESVKSVFETLSCIDCSDKIEKKNNLSYLSWCFAWQELLKRYPTSTYKVYENENGWNYFTDGRTCWVKTGVTVNGIEHIEYLPVMNYKNQSIPANAVTSFDVNKAIQRSITKAIARHGLGLYIYAGEDLPDDDSSHTQQEQRPLQHTSDPELNKLKSMVQEAITRGDLKGKALNRAVELMAKNDKVGLQGCIDYLVELEASKETA